jgi:hypothetical protein
MPHRHRTRAGTELVERPDWLKSSGYVEVNSTATSVLDRLPRATSLTKPGGRQSAVASAAWQHSRPNARTTRKRPRGGR